MIIAQICSSFKACFPVKLSLFCCPKSSLTNQYFTWQWELHVSAAWNSLQIYWGKSSQPYRLLCGSSYTSACDKRPYLSTLMYYQAVKKWVKTIVQNKDSWCISQIINIQHWGVFSHHFVTQGLTSLDTNAFILRDNFSFIWKSKLIASAIHSTHFFFSTPLSAPSGPFLFFSVQPSAAGAMESEKSQRLTPLKPLHPTEGRIRTQSVNGDTWAVTLFPPFVLHIGQRGRLYWTAEHYSISNVIH